MKKSGEELNYKLIIFDLDGTLINSLPYHLTAFKMIFSNHKILVNSQSLKLKMGKPTIDILKELKKKLKFKESPKELAQEKKKDLIKLISGQKPIFKGVEKTLSLLDKKYMIVLATGSTKKEVSSSVDKKFLSLFNFISTAENVKHYKPSPEQLLYVSKKLKIPHSRCLVLGDSIFDAQAAKNARMDFIGVTSGFTPKKIMSHYKTIKIIHSVNKLPAFLKTA